jgi:hypothetical protein
VLFPHIYGPVERRAVVGRRYLRPDPRGGFAMLYDLRSRFEAEWWMEQENLHADSLELTGTAYEPPFPYISDYGERGHTVLAADFVTTDEGTGVVHTAIAFGEDDFRFGAEHGIARSYSWTKNTLQAAGKVKRAKRRGAHRRRRERKPLVGMMLHQDGSRHCWIPDLDLALDLIVTLDDATGAIYSAFLVEEEGTFSSLRGLAEVVAVHGLPCSLYTDRGSHYFFTPKAGEKADPHVSTQVGRALAQLGIEHIAAYSPQARGRCALPPALARGRW